MKTMKFILSLTVAVLLMATPAFAQQTTKELKKELKAKASKDIRKEAKQYEKDGWRSVAGSLPVAKQLELAQMAAIEKDEDGGNRYYIGRGKGIGGNYKAAKAVAYNQAKIDLVTSAISDVEASEKSDMSNEDLGEGDVISSDDMGKSKKIQSEFSIKDIIPVVEIYRELSKGRYEVEMTVKMDAADARKRTKQALYSKKNK